MVTPQAIENRLTALSKDVDDAQTWLEQAEKEYHEAKTEYELGMAKARMTLSGAGKLRVQDVQDAALIQNAEAYIRVNNAEATVKAARGNATRIRTQVDIARSVGTSVRSSMEL